MCGILGIYSSKPNPIFETVLRLRKLQHRGKDSWGISYFHQGKVHTLKKKGMVEELTKQFPFVHQTIAHVRYTTSGENKEDEIQPLTKQNISIVHNGNIPIFQGHDTTKLFQMITPDSNIEASLIHIMNTIVASYSLLLMVDDILYVVKDRYGIRPLCIGERDDKIIISSESCALQDCKMIREVQSGQILKINEQGIHPIYLHPNNKDGICIFEFMYFMNKDSMYRNQKIETIRFQLGEILAKKETLKDKDYLVIGVPSSGISAALSYAKLLQFEYSQAIQKVNQKTCDRTFIVMDQSERVQACRKKFKYDSQKIKGRKLIIIDDTIVRGNVIQSVINELKMMEPSEIHIRIPSAPVIDICQLGIAIHSKEELLMNNRTLSDAKEYLGVDSINYLTYEELSQFSPDSYKECFGGGIDKDIISV